MQQPRILPHCHKRGTDYLSDPGCDGSTYTHTYEGDIQTCGGATTCHSPKHKWSPMYWSMSHVREHNGHAVRIPRKETFGCAPWVLRMTILGFTTQDSPNLEIHPWNIRQGTCDKDLSCQNVADFPKAFKTPPKSLREDGTCRNWTGNRGTKTTKSFASHLWSGNVMNQLTQYALTFWGWTRSPAFLPARSFLGNPLKPWGARSPIWLGAVPLRTRPHTLLLLHLQQLSQGTRLWALQVSCWK